MEMKGAPRAIPLLRDGCVAGVRTHQIGHDRSCAGRVAGGQRRILVLGLKRCAEVDGVDVHTLKCVELVLACVGKIDRRRPGQRHLDTGIPLRRSGQLAVKLDRGERACAGDSETATKALKL